MATTTGSNSLPPITSLGSGSNLDLQGILDKLKETEEQQLTLIKNQQTRVTSQISAYGILKSALTSLQTAAEKLANPATFGVTKATVTGDGFTASTGSAAIPADYTVSVKSLATADSLKSAALGDRTAKNGTGGVIKVTLADNTSVEVALGEDTSLNGITRAINDNADVGLRASIVSDGNGNSYLMLTSKTTGTQGAISKIEVAGNADLQAKLGYDAADPAASALTQINGGAKDAQVEINGVLVTSGSNTIDSAIDGVTLTLTSVPDAAAAPGRLKITADTTAIADAVKSFVSTYNTVRTQIAQLTAYDAGKEQSSVLTGDATVRTIQNTLAGALRVLAPGGDLSTLQDLGISTSTTSKDGVLDIDTEVLTKALKDNPQDVARLVGGENGLGKQVGKTIDAMLATNGLLKHRTDGLNETVESLQDSYDSASLRIEASIANLRASFVALDVFVSRMSSTAAYLTQQFQNLSPSK